MYSLLVFAVLCASCLAGSVSQSYSFSQSVGGGSGSSFSTSGQGRITAVRVWEVPNAYITGIQLRYEYIWSALVGRQYATVHEMELYPNEAIVQVSGKYQHHYIYQLIFVTSRGRFLIVGQPVQTSFNMYPVHEDGELRILSGRTNSAGITALAAHWDVMSMDQSNSTDIST
uniref:zymogen granule membrane protein 16-like n=1 Tax=Scatophagus argus TaxID=75038 RepID=UPI001ED7DB97|nr:zymogen granule membrane protein 16-like [Scatophagus argus]